MKSENVIRVRCGHEGCGRLMATVTPAGAPEGRLVLTHKSRGPVGPARPGAMTGERGGRINDVVEIADPRAWKDAPTFPRVPLMCQKHPDLGYYLSPPMLTEQLAKINVPFAATGDLVMRL